MVAAEPWSCHLDFFAAGLEDTNALVAVSLDADHVLVEGINVVKKHQKPNPAKNETGGIVEKTMPIHISNVAVFNTVTGKADRVGFKLVDGKNVRVFRSSGEAVGSKA